MSEHHKYAIDNFVSFLELEYQSDINLSAHIDGIAKWITGLASSVLIACWWAKDTLILAYQLGYHWPLNIGFVLMLVCIPAGILYRVYLYFYMKKSGALRTAYTNRIRTIIAEAVASGTKPNLWCDFDDDEIKKAKCVLDSRRSKLTIGGIIIVTALIVGFFLLVYSASQGLVKQYLQETTKALVSI